MADKKKTYKEEHGTSRVGDFLRTIGKGELLEKVTGLAGGLITGNFGGALKSMLGSSDELNEEQRAYALKLLESDLKENEEITKRWSSDMTSDSWLSKNIRPLILAYMTLVMSVLAFLDSASSTFSVKEMWVSLFTTLLMTVYVAYFGGRSYEKTKRL